MDPRAAANLPSSPLNDLGQPMYSTASISDFAHTGGSSPSIQQALHRPRTGRRTWKSLKEKREAVWPEFLEEALLEALERYRPTSSKDPSSLRRFPKRNAFISRYIKEKTGALRTPKQVGSRLQQLRETCTEERVIRLICSRDFDAPDRVAAAQAPMPPPCLSIRTAPDLRINTSIPDYSPTSSNTASSVGLTNSLSMDSVTLADSYEYPMTPYSEEFERRSSRSSPSTGGSWPHAYVHINLVGASNGHSLSRRSALESSTAFTLDLDESGLTDSPVLNGPEAWKWQRRISVTSAVPVCYHPPSVTFSSSILSPNSHYESFFRVQRDHKVLYEEYTHLEHISESHCRPSLFRTSMLPKYWGTVSNKTAELRHYMIIQDIYESAAAPDGRVDPIYTVIYQLECAIPASEQNTPDTTSSTSSSYYSPPTPYHHTPLPDEIRIPLAPILSNGAGACASDLLPYDAADFLLPPINVGCDLQSTAVTTPSWFTGGVTYHPSMAQFYSSAHSYSSLVQGQAGLDNDQLAYPPLYPF